MVTLPRRAGCPGCDPACPATHPNPGRGYGPPDTRRCVCPARPFSPHISPIFITTNRHHISSVDRSPSEFERRAAANANQAPGDARGRERTGLESCQIGRPGIHNHPLRRPPTPDSEKDSLPSAIVHLSAGDDSPQPSTGLTPAIEKLHRVHLSVVDTYPPLPTFKPGTAGNLLARAGRADAYDVAKIDG